MNKIVPNVTFANGENFEVRYMTKNPAEIFFAILVPDDDTRARLMETLKTDSNLKCIAYATDVCTEKIEEKLKFARASVLPEYYRLCLSRW